MHSVESNWAYTEIHQVSSEVAEVLATNLDSTDAVQENGAFPSSPNDAKRRRHEYMLTTEIQEAGAQATRWGQSYPAERKSSDLCIV